jgi:predicted ABC-class ATPase
MLQLLEEHSQKGMPQNVDYTLRDWVKLYKGVTISQVVLLEVSSEAVANEIFSSPKLKQLVQDFGLRRLGPRAIALNSDINLPELRRMLDKLGIVARIADDKGPPMRFTSTAEKIVTAGRLR